MRGVHKQTYVLQQWTKMNPDNCWSMSWSARRGSSQPSTCRQPLCNCLLVIEALIGGLTPTFADPCAAFTFLFMWNTTHAQIVSSNDPYQSLTWIPHLHILPFQKEVGSIGGKMAGPVDSASLDTDTLVCAVLLTNHFCLAVEGVCLIL